MAASKGELVVQGPNSNMGDLQVSASVQFESKISNKDLIDALVFQVEEDLLNNVKDLEKELEKKQKAYNKAQSAIGDFHLDFCETYKNKDVEEFAKHLKNFSEEKVNIDYRSYINSRKKKGAKTATTNFYVAATIWNDDNEFTKEFLVKYPSGLKSLEAACETARKEKDAKYKEYEETNTRANSIPRLKEKIKAKFVQTMLSNNVSDKKQLFESLKNELLKAKL